MSIMLRDLTSIEGFAREVDGDWIGLSASDGTVTPGGYTVACYTTKTQFAGHWTPDTLLARGLVLRLSSPIDKNARIAPQIRDAVVVARGMRKFFTVDAAQSEWGRVKLVDDDEGVDAGTVSIDFNAPASVSDKLDGALGIGIPVDGVMTLSTKGSFHSDEAVIGRDALAAHDPSGFAGAVPDGWSPLFEIIHPSDFHVIRYEDTDVVLLGLLRISDGYWVPSALLSTDAQLAGTSAGEIPGRFGFKTPEVYSADSLGAALERPVLDGHEGMVATIRNTNGTQDMFKIKYPLFLVLQHLKNNMSDKTILPLIAGLSNDEIIEGTVPDLTASADIPDAYADRARELIKPFETRILDIERIIADKYTESRRARAVLSDGLDLSSNDGRREYASRVNSSIDDKSIRGLMFADDDRAWRSLRKKYLKENV